MTSQAPGLRARSSDIYFQCIVEAIEIVEQPNDGGELHDLTTIEVLLHARPDLLVRPVRIGRHALRQSQRGALGRRKEMRMLVDAVHRIEQFLRSSQLLCQSSMTGHSIGAIVDLRDTDPEHLFQLAVYGARLADRD